MYIKTEGTGKEVTVAYFKVIYQHSSAITKRNHENVHHIITEPPVKIHLGYRLFIPKQRKILNWSCIKIKQKITPVVTKTLYSL
jgi:hypothetical protein